MLWKCQMQWYFWETHWPWQTTHDVLQASYFQYFSCHRFLFNMTIKGLFSHQHMIAKSLKTRDKFLQLQCICCTFYWCKWIQFKIKYISSCSAQRVYMKQTSACNHSHTMDGMIDTLNLLIWHKKYAARLIYTHIEGWICVCTYIHSYTHTLLTN